MDELVLAAYDVAVGLAGWRQLAATVAAALDCKNLLIFLFDERSGALDLLAQIGLRDPDRVEAYLAIAQKMAVRWGDAARPAGPRPSRRLALGASSVKTVRWNSLQEAVADGYLAGMEVAGAGDPPWLCIGVDIADPMEADGIQDKIERVLPHLCRAAEISRCLRAATERSSFSDALCDRLPFGVVRFDRGAAVIYSNAEAERISRLRDGFMIVSRGVRAASSADDAALQGAIREAMVASKIPFTRWLTLKRGKARSYRVLVTTISDVHRGEGNIGFCALFITDPERPATIGAEIIADALGLTAAEAKVVARLAGGTSLPEIAADLKVSINTVRTLLARAMGKTGTNSQVALVRLVLTSFSPVG